MYVVSELSLHRLMFRMDNISKSSHTVVSILEDFAELKKVMENTNFQMGEGDARIAASFC